MTRTFVSIFLVSSASSGDSGLDRRQRQRERRSTLSRSYGITKSWTPTATSWPIGTGCSLLRASSPSSSTLSTSSSPTLAAPPASRLIPNSARRGRWTRIGRRRRRKRRQRWRKEGRSGARGGIGGLGEEGLEGRTGVLQMRRHTNL